MEEIEKLRNDIKYSLLRIGIRANLRGFKYLCTAVELSILYPDLNLCNGIFVQVSDIYNTPYHSVERDIRFAINLIKKSKSFLELNKMFSKKVVQSDTKLTSGKLINLLVKYYLKRK